jgi:predicted dehydrogenase
MKIGVIGTGFAEQHLKWIEACPNLTATSIAYDRRPERARDLARCFGIEEVIRGGVKLAGSADVDAVVITAPPFLHEQFAAVGLEAGHVVISEKPLAHTLAAAKKMTSLAGQRATRTMVCFQWRDLPAFGALRSALANGSAGDLLALDLVFHHDFLADVGTAWPWRHRGDLAGGGALADLGVHLFDLIRWISGREWQVLDARRKVVYAERLRLAADSAEHQSREDEAPLLVAETDDMAIVHLESPGEPIFGRIYVSRVSRGYQELSVTATGTLATLRAEADPSGVRSSFERFGECPGRQEFAVSPNPYLRLSSDLSSGQETVPDFRDGLAAQDLMTQALGCTSSPKVPQA